jgi:tripartite-type tricarboxylate transporter receptor subunit TctC
MKRKGRIISAIWCIFILQCALLGVAGAKVFPEKPIQFLVGFVPGSVTDLSARAISKVAPKYLEQPLVVVNMPGAASTVALNELAKSPPDGHTIALMTTAYRSLIVHQQKVPYDTKILKPLLSYAEFRHVLFVKGDSPYAKLEDLISFGQKNPGAIKYGHSGKGTSIHIQGALFFKGANVKAADVPYKGSAEYTQAVLGGHITAGVIDISGIKQHISAGTLKPVVAFMDHRMKDFPQIPTSKEKGFADVSTLNPLVSLCVHKDTHPDRTKQLHDALKKAVEDPEFTKVLDDMGLKWGYVTGEAVEEVITKAENVSIPLLKEMKLFVE